MCTEIKSGNCEITEIRNYRGVINEKEEIIIPPYLSIGNINSIVKSHPTNKSIKIKESVGKESAGYTAAHILGKMNGVPFELQIKGNQIKNVDDGTHLLHDVSLGKLNSNLPEIQKIAELYKNLSPEEQQVYDKYILNCYKQARLSEQTGEKTVITTLTKKTFSRIKYEISYSNSKRIQININKNNRES